MRYELHEFNEHGETRMNTDCFHVLQIDKFVKFVKFVNKKITNTEKHGETRIVFTYCK